MNHTTERHPILSTSKYTLIHGLTSPPLVYSPKSQNTIFFFSTDSKATKKLRLTFSRSSSLHFPNQETVFDVFLVINFAIYLKVIFALKMETDEREMKDVAEWEEERAMKNVVEREEEDDMMGKEEETESSGTGCSIQELNLILILAFLSLSAEDERLDFEEIKQTHHDLVDPKGKHSTSFKDLRQRQLNINGFRAPERQTSRLHTKIQDCRHGRRI